MVVVLLSFKGVLDALLVFVLHPLVVRETRVHLSFLLFGRRKESSDHQKGLYGTWKKATGNRRITATWAPELAAKS
ncbi:uncharacterized protein [Miscanthus floridulus]